MAKRVMVTGCSGYLGTVLCRALLQHPIVERVYGVDLAAPGAFEHEKFRFRRADIRDEFLLRSLLQDENIDAVFHLAFMTGEPKDAVLAREVNVGGTLAVLEAANKCPSVRKLVLAGSTSAYGARRGNPARFREEDPLRASTLRCGVHKRQAEEELARAMPTVRRELKIVTLRICHVAGACDGGRGPVELLRGLPLAVSVWFHRGGLQFIGEDDLARVMLKVLESAEASGVYNVAPDDFATPAQIFRALGKPRLPAPYLALWLALYLARRLAGRLDLTEHAASYLAYPVVAANEKLKKALGVHFSRGSLEAFAHGLIKPGRIVATTEAAGGRTNV